MPGKYGSVPFVVGKPESVKPARSGICACGRETYRERFTLGEGWAWLCSRCGPEPVGEVRKFARGTKNPIVYQPGQGKGREHWEKVAAEIKKGNKVARDSKGREVSGWAPRLDRISQR